MDWHHCALTKNSNFRFDENDFTIKNMLSRAIPNCEKCFISNVRAQYDDLLFVLMEKLNESIQNYTGFMLFNKSKTGYKYSQLRLSALFSRSRGCALNWS
ncbi:hypothetical protein RF11_11137 [Thelohanellus kitauei]|uniref:Uncharacterized protein n=1 Tax=Thelohanellus kitauei TaxID=669202 RepID=A0A0C2MEG2_THEKT|nr:hypothetical protein RF11_11137 [Thelohanellus kitauei]